MQSIYKIELADHGPFFVSSGGLAFLPQETCFCLCFILAFAAPSMTNNKPRASQCIHREVVQRNLLSASFADHISCCIGSRTATCVHLAGVRSHREDFPEFMEGPPQADQG